MASAVMNSRGQTIYLKEYQQDQLVCLPPSLEEWIPERHVVRVVNEAIERMDLRSLLEGYRGGGTSSYHPKMLLKVLVYGYTQRMYSSRMMAKGLRENIHLMWLSGGQRPDFRTINRFRSSYLKEGIEQVFSAVLTMLLEAGLVRLEHYFLDGTKIEASASKYSFVWGKATKKFKGRLEGPIKGLINHIDQVSEEENRHYGDKDLEELGEERTLTPEQLEKTVEKLNTLLKKKPKDRALKKAKKKLESDYLPRYQKYLHQEKILERRNSYAKTDPDATFMRMKDDHMRNGQLKAAYNVQVGTENQFIVGYSLHQRPTDTTLLKPHLEAFQKQTGRLPEHLIADAGYGSLENYRFLEERAITPYVKYNNFHFEQTRTFKRNPYRVENLGYDTLHDCFICPQGKALNYQTTIRTCSENEFISERRIAHNLLKWYSTSCRLPSA